MADWSMRRWGVTFLGAVGVALLVGLPTVMIPNPVFDRMIPVVWWNYPVWLVTSVLAGLLLATYVRDDGADLDEVEDETAVRRGTVGGLLSFFAVGCPVCNKIVLLALGTSGALTWFAPLQPLLGLASVAFLAWALRERLRGEQACALPASSPSDVSG